MFNSPIVEVAIGMVFFYLLLSWLCSAANELLEGWLRNRAKDLRRGIGRLLDDPQPSGGLATKLYSHGLIRPLYMDGKHLPAYIPARNFSLAVMDLMAPAPLHGLQTLREALSDPHHQASETLRGALLTLIDASGDDVPKFRENLENWYNSAMDSVSSWYKRRTQILILALGCAIAIVLNADSVLMINRLWSDSALRSSMVAQAEKAQQAGSYEEWQNLRLPAGWSGPDAMHQAPWVYHTWSERLGWSWRLLAGHWIGWLLTAFAISMGAPFWFDLLNKVIAVRSAVKPKEIKEES